MDALNRLADNSVNCPRRARARVRVKFVKRRATFPVLGQRHEDESGIADFAFFFFSFFFSFGRSVAGKQSYHGAAGRNFNFRRENEGGLGRVADMGNFSSREPRGNGMSALL